MPATDAEHWLVAFSGKFGLKDYACSNVGAAVVTCYFYLCDVLVFFNDFDGHRWGWLLLLGRFRVGVVRIGLRFVCVRLLFVVLLGRVFR